MWSTAEPTSVNVAGQPPPLSLRRYSMFQVAIPIFGRSLATGARLRRAANFSSQQPPWITTATGNGPLDRKSVVEGKGVSVRGDQGGVGIIKKKKSGLKHYDDIK